MDEVLTDVPFLVADLRRGVRRAGRGGLLRELAASRNAGTAINIVRTVGVGGNEMGHEGRAVSRLLAVAATLAVTPALSVTLAVAADAHPAAGSAARAYLAGLGTEATAGMNDDPHGAFDNNAVAGQRDDPHGMFDN